MASEDQDQQALRREWVFGAFFVAAAFVVALAMAAYFSFREKPALDVPTQTPVAEGAATQQQQPANDPTQVCRTALGNAQSFGIIPAYGRLTDSTPRETDVQGRYICQAATPDTRYVLSVDLVCEQIDQSQCVNIYSIVQDDGTALYQRQQ